MCSGRDLRVLKPTGGALFDPTSPSCEDSAPAASAGQDILRLYTIYLERNEGREGGSEREREGGRKRGKGGKEGGRGREAGRPWEGGKEA